MAKKEPPPPPPANPIPSDGRTEARGMPRGGTETTAPATTPAPSGERGSGNTGT